jgi:hypothetical protein
MVKVVMTLKRDDTSKDWVIPNKETIDKGIFSKEEIDVVVNTRNAYSYLPGYVTSSTDFVDDYTYTFTIEFDTQEAAKSAYNAIKNPPTNSLIYIRQQLMNLKRNRLGLNYEFNVELK